MTNDMKQSIIEEASILMTGHPSKDARWFAKSVYEFFMAEPPAEQEPVGYRQRLPSGEYAYCKTAQFFDNPEPIYTAPKPAKPAEPEPYDQTALELCDKCGWKTLIPGDGCLNCERQPKAEPQEPVAWGMPRSDGAIIDCISPEEHAHLEGGYTVPLYTAPQPRKPLTDEEIEDLGRGKDGHIDFARAVIAAYKEKNKMTDRELPKPALWFDMETGHWRVLSKPDRPTYQDYYTAEQMREYAHLVRAEVLEEAAGVCDDKHYEWRFGDGEDAASGPKDCAAAIRQLKEKT